MSYRPLDTGGSGSETSKVSGRRSRIADFGAQHTTLELGQRNRSVISALLKQVKDRNGAMQVPGQNSRLSTTFGAGVVVGMEVVGRGGRGVCGVRWGPGRGSDLSPTGTGVGRSKTAPAKLLRMGPASKDRGLTGFDGRSVVGLDESEAAAPCFGFESQQTAPRSHRFGGLLITTDGLVQKADIRPGKQTPGQRFGVALVVVVGAWVVVVVVVALVVAGRGTAGRGVDRVELPFCDAKNTVDVH